jgi:hypothetical protein
MARQANARGQYLINSKFDSLIVSCRFKFFGRVAEDLIIDRIGEFVWKEYNFSI